MNTITMQALLEARDALLEASRALCASNAPFGQYQRALSAWAKLNQRMNEMQPVEVVQADKQSEVPDFLRRSA